MKRKRSSSTLSSVVTFTLQGVGLAIFLGGLWSLTGAIAVPLLMLGGLTATLGVLATRAG